MPFELPWQIFTLPTFQYKKVKDCSIREFQNDLVINHKYLHWELIDTYRHLEWLTSIADLVNETHTTANYIHMVINLVWAMLPPLSSRRFIVAMNSLPHIVLQIML